MTSTRFGTIERTTRGKCHRCGWTAEVTKVGRKRAEGLHMGPHAALLCDECIGDLERGSTPAARPVAAVAHATHAFTKVHWHRVA
jgi:hypothetical protein